MLDQNVVCHWLAVFEDVFLSFPGKAVMVNGMPVSLPKSYSGSGLTLEKIGLFVSVSSQLGVTLLWDGGTAHFPY